MPRRTSRLTDTVADLKRQALVAGWREWVALPRLGVAYVKAKLDTGARTSSLHVFRLERFRREGRHMGRFEIHPIQRSTRRSITCEHEIVDERRVRSSSGHSSLRPVIVTSLEFGGRKWRIELTLASRDEMGFRMLLGRQAVRKKVLIDPGRSFLGGVPASLRKR